VLPGGSLAVLLGEIDELHTLTSLSGFEALLRLVPVTVYGRPFYAGWGLTRDVAMPPRGRTLALDELAAGALILYPRYLDPVTRQPCGPETIVARLARPGLCRPGLPARMLVAARRGQGRLVEALRSWTLHFAQSQLVRR
jgi:capsular polysaccharide export protein